MATEFVTDERCQPRGRCNLCGAAEARELYTARDRLGNSGQTFSISECVGCGVRRTLPEMTDAEMARFYPGDYWGAAAEPTEDWIRRSQSDKVRFLLRCGLNGGRILDVGCGSGFFLRALNPQHWERVGIETGEAATTAARRALGDQQVLSGTLIEAHLEASSFDVITFWSVVEHTNNPRENLLEARRLLRGGGSLVVQVPNAGSYQARYFEGDWFALDAPRHRYHFTTGSLQRLLTETGFTPYHLTQFSRAHNAHALKQSLKTRLIVNANGLLARTLFYLSLPLIKPADMLMTVLGQGATITVASRAK